MALIEFENYPSTDTAINASNLNYNFSEILNLMCPIGRGFIDFTETDYSNYLGFTWERELVGLTPVGLDTTQEEFDTIGKIGGEKTHVLTLDEIPSNIIQTASSGNNSDGFIGRAGYNSDGTYNFGGQNLAHNNLQPYKVVAYWKRIA